MRRFDRAARARGACARFDSFEVEARHQLARWFPDRDVLGTARVRVTKEAAATLVADPATEALRPEPGPWPGLRNLWVCGDWTRTELPSTLEGAVGVYFATSALVERDLLRIQEIQGSLLEILESELSR